LCQIIDTFALKKTEANIINPEQAIWRTLNSREKKMLPKDSDFQEKYQKFMMERKKFNRKEFWKKRIRKLLIIYLRKIKIFNKLLSPTTFEFGEITNQSNYFSNDRIAIYTSIFGEYDNVIEPECVPDNCDFYIITDKSIKKGSVWRPLLVNLKDYDLEDKTNVIKNRFFKMFADKLFSKYKYSIYVDGNIKIFTDLTEFIHDMNRYGIKMHNHYRRNCVYKEIDQCLLLGKDTSSNLIAHREHLVSERLPKEYGMLEAPVIVREHHNPSCIKLMNEWWYEFSKYSKRDQISLPYVLWKNNIKVCEIALLGNDINSNYAIKKMKHNNQD